MKCLCASEHGSRRDDECVEWREGRESEREREATGGIVKPTGKGEFLCNQSRSRGDGGLVGKRNPARCFCRAFGIPRMAIRDFLSHVSSNLL